MGLGLYIELSQEAKTAGLDYGSTRTIVGLGMPAAPPYATEPRYFTPAVRPLKVRLIVPDVARTAVDGAETVILPAAAVPKYQACSLKGELPTTPQPWTTTVRAMGEAVGEAKVKLTSSAEVPEPLLPTRLVPWNTHKSMSVPGFTSASNKE